MTQQTLRNRLFSAPRRIFGVLVICWLNMAIAPCAMALQFEQDCADGPRAVEQMADHHGHHDVSPAQDCVTVQSDCCELAAASLDTRGDKFKKLPDNFAIPVADFPWHEDYTSPTHYVAAHPPDPVGSSPPLHKLYCVYLD